MDLEFEVIEKDGLRLFRHHGAPKEGAPPQTLLLTSLPVFHGFLQGRLAVVTHEGVPACVESTISRVYNDEMFLVQYKALSSQTYSSERQQAPDSSSYHTSLNPHDFPPGYKIIIKTPVLTTECEQALVQSFLEFLQQQSVFDPENLESEILTWAKFLKGDDHLLNPEYVSYALVVEQSEGRKRFALETEQGIFKFNSLGGAGYKRHAPSPYISCSRIVVWRGENELTSIGILTGMEITEQGRCFFDRYRLNEIFSDMARGKDFRVSICADGFDVGDRLELHVLAEGNYPWVMELLNTYNGRLCDKDALDFVPNT